jgi:transposase
MEKHLYSVYDKLIKDRNQEMLNRIMNLIKDNCGVIERSLLLRYTRLLKKDFNNYIDTLIEGKSLAVRIKKTKTKSAVYYKIIGD